jgi:hypothetical protein
MAFEIRDGEGSLWKNDNRRPDKQDAHARGQCMIAGKLFWISAWTNETKDGTKYQSLKFKPKDEQPQQRQADEAYDAAKARADIDDDLPF